LSPVGSEFDPPCGCGRRGQYASNRCSKLYPCLMPGMRPSTGAASKSSCSQLRQNGRNAGRVCQLGGACVSAERSPHSPLPRVQPQHRAQRQPLPVENRQQQRRASAPAVGRAVSRSGNQLGPGLGRLAVLALTNTGEGWVGCLLRWGSSTAPGTLLLPGLRSL
jgi:hypothetical protein